jgi:hypothetical protein
MRRYRESTCLGKGIIPSIAILSRSDFAAGPRPTACKAVAAGDSSLRPGPRSRVAILPSSAAAP